MCAECLFFQDTEQDTGKIYETLNKYMIDDYLFNLYELDFSTLMMLINSRQLFSNPEISADYQKLMAEFNQAAY